MISDWEFANAQNIKPRKTQKEIILGYASGTRTHDDDFLEIEKPIIKILKKYPQVKLRIIGYLNLPKSFNKFKNRIEKKGLINWKELSKELIKFDINLAPLEKIELNEAKSDLKFFEAACVSVPTVATDLGAFHENILAGETGFLAKNKDDWFEKIEKLVLDKILRQKIGENAKKYVYNFRNSKKGAENFKRILRKL